MIGGGWLGTPRPPARPPAPRAHNPLSPFRSDLLAYLLGYFLITCVVVLLLQEMTRLQAEAGHEHTDVGQAMAWFQVFGCVSMVSRRECPMPFTTVGLLWPFLDTRTSLVPPHNQS